MAVEVKVTSVLQKVTGAKVVAGRGRHRRRGARRPRRQVSRASRTRSCRTASLHRFVNIYLNDEDIRYLEQLDTPLKDGDTISILPALAGGA